MSSRRESYHVIKSDMMTSGVSTALVRSKIPETDLWSSKNMVADFRGALRKKHKEHVLGAKIYEPTPVRSENGEEVSLALPMRYGQWNPESIVGNNHGMNLTSNDVLAAYCVASTSLPKGYRKWTRDPLEDEVFNTDGSYDNSFTFSFSFKATSLLDIDGLASDDPGLYVMFAVKDGKQAVRLYLGASSLWVQNTASSFLELPWPTGFNPADGVRHTLKFSYSPTENGDAAIANIDGTDFGQAPGFSSTNYRINASGAFVRAEVHNSTGMGADDILSASMWGFIIRDAYDGLVGASMRDMTTVKKFAEQTKYTAHTTYFGTENYVWRDQNFLGMVDPFIRLDNSSSRFASFKDKTIVLDYGEGVHTKLHEIDLDGQVRVLDDAPPVRFATEHRARLWASGDVRFPSRVYFSEDRNPNSWFAPAYDADGQETVDEVLDAGYINIPAKNGERVTGLYGGVYDSLLIFSNRAVYRLTGTDPTNFVLSVLSENFGAFNQESIARVSNSVWTASENGIGVIEPTDKYGDMLTSKLSFDIQDVFSDAGFEYRRIDTERFDRSSMTFNKGTGLMYFSYVPVGGRVPSKVMVLNTYTNRWFGPWDIEHTTMASVLTGFPIRESVAYGTSDGFVRYFGSYEDGDAEVEIQSPMLTGRSVDPRIEGMVKSWGTMRIIVNPTGKWDINVEWSTEDRPLQSASRELAPKNAKCIEDLFTIEDDQIGSWEDVHVIDIPLNIRGRGLLYTITSNAPSIAILGVEVDFMVDGYEKE